MPTFGLGWRDSVRGQQLLNLRGREFAFTSEMNVLDLATSTLIREPPRRHIQKARRFVDGVIDTIVVDRVDWIALILIAALHCRLPCGVALTAG